MTLPTGCTLAYDDLGTGCPLVLLHAFPLDRTMWQPQHPLSDRCRLLAVDLPGFGDSPTAPFTIDGVADAIATWMAELRITPAVVGGLSMGGYVALALARRHPDKLRGLILADTRAGADDPATQNQRNQSIALVTQKGTAALFAGLLPKILSDRTCAEKPQLVEHLKAMAARQPAAAVAAALAALRDRPDATPGLAAIAVPTLVLVGEHDAITPPLIAANLAAQIRTSRLVHIPGAGHLANVENPDAFNAALRSFLGELTG
ncbi:MAG: alpha/beta fold hydrolase [Gemmataceae bacterium]|nr:alpha/beta hydrolase [Gemmata sp.]MDW8198517.1 alpha/beta fold hydrolase [Gemmataceae bacterium]